MMTMLAACGGDSRPSASDLTAAIRSGESGIGVSADQAPCVATLMVDSDLSDEALRRYVALEDQEFDDADRAAFQAFMSRLKECGVTLPGG